MDLIRVCPSKTANFTGLYAAHARDVYRFVLYLSGNAAMAQDITSEVFLRVWMAKEPVQVTHVRSWLFVVARNIYLHEMRHIGRKQPLDPGMASAHSVEASAAAKQEFVRVSQAMTLLPEVDRRALALRVVEGLPYEEIAARLHVSVAAAKVKVHRARRRLEARKQTFGIRFRLRGE